MNIDKEILKSIISALNPDYTSSCNIEIAENKGIYRSIVVNAPGNAYRKDTGDMLFARLKTQGKEQYISFNSKYSYLFNNADIDLYTVNSDPGFIRINLNTFIFASEMNSAFPTIVQSIFEGLFNFEPFGCCSRYVECSDNKKCIHTDLIYALACYYRKNLTSGNIFYGVNRNNKEGCSMLGISISINPDTGEVEVKLVEGKSEYRKRNKGRSLLSFPSEYVVIDTETTGLDPDYCELIEVAAIRVVDDIEVDRFQTLIKPNDDIPDFIVELTGITNEMVENAPTPDIAFPELINFIGDSIIVAHNAHFDINFLYDYYEQYMDRPFSNDFICTMRISRRAFPEMSNHKLSTLCKNMLGIVPPHRALGDALAAWEILKVCKAEINATIGFEEFAKSRKYHLKAGDIKATTNTFSENHPLYGKYCVFTGTLSKMVRRDAMQTVVNLGGYCLNNVTRNADYLIMGIQDYSKFADGEKSNKLKKAEKLIQNGYEIEILSENILYDLLLNG